MVAINERKIEIEVKEVLHYEEYGNSLDVSIYELIKDIGIEYSKQLGDDYYDDIDTVIKIDCYVARGRYLFAKATCFQETEEI